VAYAPREEARPGAIQGEVGMNPKSDYETFVTRIGRRDGKRTAERKPLNVPWYLALGRYEQLSDLAVRDAITDLRAEQARRCVKDTSALVITMQDADRIAADLAELVRTTTRGRNP
jgi:hypothetical protein